MTTRRSGSEHADDPASRPVLPDDAQVPPAGVVASQPSDEVNDLRDRPPTHAEMRREQQRLQERGEETDKAAAATKLVVRTRTAARHTDPGRRNP